MVTHSSLRSFLEDGFLVTLLAQAHARALLVDLGSPRSEWPRFNGDLDRRLQYASHYEIFAGLGLLSTDGTADVADVARAALQRGAEALEFLSAVAERDAPDRVSTVLRAAVTYAIGGYAARAFVLTETLRSESASLSTEENLVAAVLRRDLRQARGLAASVFSDPRYSDARLTSDLAAGLLSPSEAIERALTRSLASVTSCFVEHAESGDAAILARAIAIAEDAAPIARDHGLVDSWWWLVSQRQLLLQYRAASSWGALRSFSTDAAGRALIETYAASNVRGPRPFLELWPSQQAALPLINAVGRPSFCVRMPTSAGKTRVAELAILRFLADHQDAGARCFYVAPFRSLAAEIERDLRQHFGPLGIAVSMLYGGYDLSVSDQDAEATARILVLTPEKLEAVLRLQPEAAANAKLVILDEGHIVDGGRGEDRHLRIELFFHRVLRLLHPHGCRFVVMSAVLPNAEDFAAWVSGSTENLVSSTWRPARQLLGVLRWTGRAVSVEVTDDTGGKMGHPVYLRRFAEQRPCKGVAGLGRRQKPFPGDAREAFAHSAILFARRGPTLVFVPIKEHAASFARDVSVALTTERLLGPTEGEDASLARPSGPAWERCRDAIVDALGPDAEVLSLLERGIALHHADLPQRVRLAIEELVREGTVRLLVATSTLAQGVNLPIETILVKSLWQGDAPLSTFDFWNICGRAGRAFRENEGLVLFCVDSAPHTGRNPRTALRKRQLVVRTQNRIGDFIRSRSEGAIRSSLLRVLSDLATAWKRRYPNASIAELCDRLVGDDLAWVGDADAETIGRWLNTIDTALLAMEKEAKDSLSTAEELAAYFAGSLALIQCQTDPRGAASPTELTDILAARLASVRRRFPVSATRQRLYRLGFSLADCAIVEEDVEVFLTLYLDASAWDEWDDRRRVDHLLQLAERLLRLHDLALRDVDWTGARAVLERWLHGQAVPEVWHDATVGQLFEGPMALSSFLDEVCGYRLAWGAGGLYGYLSTVASERGVELPPVTSFFSSMYRYGLTDPLALSLLPILGEARSIALEVARVTRGVPGAQFDLVSWVREAAVDDLVSAGLRRDLAERAVLLRDRDGSSNARSESLYVELTLASEAGALAGERVLLVRVAADQEEAAGIQLMRPDGEVIGEAEMPELLSPWLAAASSLSARVESARRVAVGSWSLELDVTRVGL